ncbi:MAG: hypothetical protein UT90_C0001G0023 [Parcubacteria group bacterium GW2011_GWA1_40_21]|nr:MAG: hypothetical protein UT80_C0049G0002 [Parcubacteria group bacterium GW2011_GWC1_40_13]KKR54150.1 MAG: hypothetical protein UT90_C0001G0023 [Parcubacteria group bacterium GW2011_GWA1_40_21]
MARRKDKEKAIKLRLKGFSYSQIKDKIDLSKSTLSNWLSSYPLSDERIRELRDWSPRRIERCRIAKQLNRQKKLSSIYIRAGKDIKNLNKRETLLAGLFLYWGEGGKTSRSTVSMTNTDPSVLRFFIRWMEDMGIHKKRLRVILQLYRDMNVNEEVNYWSRILNITKKQFRKPRVKDSLLSDITYKNGFGHGTCTVVLYSAEIYDYIIMCLKYIRDDISMRL